MDDYITAETLTKLGINLEGQDIESLISHLNDSVEERVGAEITESLDDVKLEALVGLQETGTDEQVGEWLTANVPELEAIVSDNIDIVLGELASNVDGVNNVA
jgi:hypothetical protein